MRFKNDVGLKLQYVFSYAKLVAFLGKNRRELTDLQGIKANFVQQ